MNIHHLELFYYVAKHGGIAAAVRKIPYGIQQPAVSGQIAKLEESLGVKLFDRRPFSLSPAGVDLFAFIQPFFENLGGVADKIRSQSAPHLRIAAPSLALHDYLPGVLHQMRETFPSFRLNLHEASQTEAERLLHAQEIDLAITSIEQKPRSGLHSQILMELPLCLLVPKRHRLKQAKELWGCDRIEETLITFPSTEPIAVQFQKGLKALGVEWFAGIEVNSISLIECYVANGFGIGLIADVPATNSHPQTRRVPLEGFPQVSVAAVWAGKLAPITQQFLGEVGKQAKMLAC